MTIPELAEISSNMELLTPQCHENVAVIPLKTAEINYSLDILTLKKGFELGLAEVKECETSTVNTIIVENKSVTPLILVDGEEVVGGDQNRIVNSTIIIAPKTSSKVPVSCTERGRWGYKSEFENSEYMANFETRKMKRNAVKLKRSVQDAVWSSIDTLEKNCHYTSPTSAMAESYEKEKVNLNEILESFEIVDGQNGVLIIANGEIKGFELLLNNEIYKEFHEKILKSYLIDCEIKNKTFAVNPDESRLFIENAIDSAFESIDSYGLEKAYEFENESGVGTLYVFEDEIIHVSYFKSKNTQSSDGELNDTVNVNAEI